MHVRTYTSGHKVHVHMQKNDSGHLVVPPRAGSWEKACTHVHECTPTQHIHTHTTQHVTYTKARPLGVHWIGFGSKLLHVRKNALL